ncbi:AI-2E family transporter [Micromonospora sp. WMMD1082]|uniref:AI-2E family transporter n=1 Tax=Micromonospora sp. WMMD1082 TaxID=3016104 RepID=UPI002416BCC2|nr:AI-2E family transporter [Micromonospora sp. WMMD1082]MDG4795822.1 AI-2E family transporter [Micromonospora sp. WMMD1082]
MSEGRRPGTDLAGHEEADVVAGGAGRTPGKTADRDAGPRQTWTALPWLVRSAVVWSACLVVIAAGLYLLAQITMLVTPLAIAVAATLFLAALLDPVQLALRRLRLPAALAALLTVLLLLGVLGGVGVLVWNIAASQFSELGDELGQGLERTRDFITSTLPVTDEQLDGLLDQLRQAVSQQEVDPVSSARTVAEAFGSALLALVLLFFLLKDGRSMWHWTLRRMTGPNRGVAAEAGRVGWHTLGSYSRGTMLIAGIDAVGIGLALVLLGVPLAFPLALITFIGGFVPIIGATVAGAVAVLVALAAKGPTTALLTLAAVIAVQQIEGNLLEPLVMKRQVRLHPVVILLAVTAGTLIAGIAGAFVAVPITAVAWRVIDSVLRQRQAAKPPGRPAPPRPPHSSAPPAPSAPSDLPAPPASSDRPASPGPPTAAGPPPSRESSPPHPPSPPHRPSPPSGPSPEPA